MEFNKKSNRERTLGIAILVLVAIAGSTSLLAHRLYSDNRALQRDFIENRQVIVTPLVNNNSPEGYSFLGERGDSRYLRLMALSFLSLRLDVTAQTVEQSHEVLVSHLSTELREKLIPILSQEKKSISVDNGSSVFYPRKILVSPSNGIVDIQGDLVFSYGIRKTPALSKHYRLRIETRSSKLELTDFKEITNETN